MDYAQIIAALIEIVGPVAGQQLANADRDKVLALLQASRDEFGRIQVPKLKELTAELTPDTELSRIREDPQHRQQQREADSGLRDIVGSGGLTLEDKAALNAIRSKVSRSESAGRNAIANDMAARGTLDSGAQLAMQLHNQQDSANRAAEAGEATAGTAQRRAYEAILARGKMAGEGLDRDYRQKYNAAAAQDSINRGNTDIRNLTSRFNAGLPQQNYENELRKAAGAAPANSALANFFGNRAQGTQDQWAQTSRLGAGYTRELFGEKAPKPKGYGADGYPYYSEPDEWAQWPGGK